jgi:filamentous hemagglutinin
MDPHAPMYDSRYGLQPSYNAAVNVYNEVLKYELNALLVMTELGGIARGIAAAANLGSAARVASAAKAAPGINWGKQGKHLRTHNNYTEGRSVLTVNPAKLAGRAGTGQQVGKLPVGTPGSKERVNFGETIGDYIQDGVGPPQPTSIGIIHYAKDSIHIVPARP